MTEFELIKEVDKQIWADYENKSSEDYLPFLEARIKTLVHLIHSLKTDDVQMPEWKVFSEPLLLKLVFHASTILEIFRGVKLPNDVLSQEVKIFDEPSVIILLRSCTENYLTFHYLLVDEISDEEKYFRFIVWKYAGIKQRSSFFIETPEAKEKQQSELQILMALQKEIEESTYFSKLKSPQRKEILKGVKPRLETSWKDLIIRSNLSPTFFKNLYGFKSSYTHSEFISVLQIKQGHYGHSKTSNESNYILMLLSIILSKSMLNLKSIFPTVEGHFKKLPIKTQIEMGILSQIGNE